MAFSPAMAQRWYAIAEGRPLPEATPEANEGSAVPLLAMWSADGLDLVWDGVGETFAVELAEEDRKPVASFITDLTAARVSAPESVRFWRVRPASGPYSPWTPISPE